MSEKFLGFLVALAFGLPEKLLEFQQEAQLDQPVPRSGCSSQQVRTSTTQGLAPEAHGFSSIAFHPGWKGHENAVGKLNG